MIYVISKATFGSYNVRDIQCNANWDCCPYSDYALIPDAMVDGILATQGYCDITLNDSGNEVVSFTARTIPSVPEECCGSNTVLSVNGVKANTNGELSLSAADVGAVPRGGTKSFGLQFNTNNAELEISIDGSNYSIPFGMSRNAVYHTGNKPTAADVGAMHSTVALPNGDANQALSPGVYRIIPTDKNIAEGTHGKMLVMFWDVNTVVQLAHHSSGWVTRATSTGGGASTFSEWEWFDPPRYNAVSYRTTKRFLGSPVYQYHHDFGYLPNDSEAHTELTALPSNAEIIHSEGWWVDLAGTTSGTFNFWFGHNGSHPTIGATTDFNASTRWAHVLIEYRLK